MHGDVHVHVQVQGAGARECPGRTGRGAGSARRTTDSIAETLEWVETLENVMILQRHGAGRFAESLENGFGPVASSRSAVQDDLANEADRLARDLGNRPPCLPSTR